MVGNGGGCKSENPSAATVPVAVPGATLESAGAGVPSSGTTGLHSIAGASTSGLSGGVMTDNWRRNNTSAASCPPTLWPRSSAGIPAIGGSTCFWSEFGRPRSLAGSVLSDVAGDGRLTAEGQPVRGIITDAMAPNAVQGPLKCRRKQLRASWGGDGRVPDCVSPERLGYGGPLGRVRCSAEAQESAGSGRDTDRAEDPCQKHGCGVGVGKLRAGFESHGVFGWKRANSRPSAGGVQTLTFACFQANKTDKDWKAAEFNCF